VFGYSGRDALKRAGKIFNAVAWWLILGVVFGLIASLPDVYDQLAGGSFLGFPSLTARGQFLPAGMALCAGGALTLVRNPGNSPTNARLGAVVLAFSVALGMAIYFGQAHTELLAVNPSPEAVRRIAAIGGFSWTLYQASVLVSSTCAVLSEW
jgi:hypothetical protein